MASLADLQPPYENVHDHFTMKETGHDDVMTAEDNITTAVCADREFGIVLTTVQLVEGAVEGAWSCYDMEGIEVTPCDPTKNNFPTQAFIDLFTLQTDTTYVVQSASRLMSTYFA